MRHANHAFNIHRANSLIKGDTKNGLQNIQNNGLIDEVVPGDDEGNFWQRLRKYRGMILSAVVIVGMCFVYYLLYVWANT